MAGAVHDAHAALAEARLQPIAAGDDLTNQRVGGLLTGRPNHAATLLHRRRRLLAPAALGPAISRSLGPARGAASQSRTGPRCCCRARRRG
ncbi:Hypothetical protein A7982_06286 [Minicystis rosea]|nr:Hypothetical protein A7982_06286 [Minicystis rosea]